MAKVPERFVAETLWPAYLEMSSASSFLAASTLPLFGRRALYSGNRSEVGGLGIPRLQSPGIFRLKVGALAWD
jgi:hypothetical protein